MFTAIFFRCQVFYFMFILQTTYRGTLPHLGSFYDPIKPNVTQRERFQANVLAAILSRFFFPDW